MPAIHVVRIHAYNTFLPGLRTLTARNITCRYYHIGYMILRCGLKLPKRVYDFYI